MDELIGLFIEDEAANVDVYTRLFALEGLKLDCLDKLPLTVDSYYDIILEKNVDFLIIDFHLEKQVTYKGIIPEHKSVSGKQEKIMKTAYTRLIL